jgi:hypothetical protein
VAYVVLGHAIISTLQCRVLIKSEYAAGIFLLLAGVYLASCQWHCPATGCTFQEGAIHSNTPPCTLPSCGECNVLSRHLPLPVCGAAVAMRLLQAYIPIGTGSVRGCAGL